jgi:hypothetical protein
MPKQRLRELRDPRTLRALAHPFRLTLLDLVERRGTLTSAEASKATGESTGSCSFHLRQLAKYGFLEPADGRDGRERRWRRAGPGERVPELDDRAATQLSRVFVERFAAEAAGAVERWPALPPEWRRGSMLDHELLYVTPAELRSLSRAVTDLFAAYHERTRDLGARPRGARAVRGFAMLFPLDDE